jgi:hypothetical protein
MAGSSRLIWHCPRTAVRVLVALASLTASCRDAGEPTVPTVQTDVGGPNVTPTVSSVVPDNSRRGVTLDITINGSGFDRGSVARLERDGVPADGITTNSTRFVTPLKLIANVTVAVDADPALYDVAVTTSNGRKGVGIELFEVLYELVDIGVIGGLWSMAVGINDLRQVIGASCTQCISCTQTCYPHAFFWTESGGLEDLGILPGYTRSEAFSLNNRGQILGTMLCFMGDPECGGRFSGELVLWEKLAGEWNVTRLGLPGGGNTGDLNNANQFVRQGKVYSLSGGAALAEALPAYAPGPVSMVAKAINDAGMVAGLSVANDGSGAAQAIVWFRDQAGTWRLLPLSPLLGHNIGLAHDIGEIAADGQVRVVGQSGRTHSRTGYTPVRWTLAPDGAGGWEVALLEELQLPFRASNGHVWGGNTGGEAVGEYMAGGIFSAVKWMSSGDFEALPVPHAGLSRARDINDEGWIVGLVWDNAQACERAALWRLQ